MANNPGLTQQSLSDWEEHETADGNPLDFLQGGQGISSSTTGIGVGPNHPVLVARPLPAHLIFRPTHLTKEGYEYILASNMKYSQSMKQEARKGTTNAGTVNVTPPEEKEQESEPLVYATKQEAENAFKALLESTNVHADWTWEQYVDQKRRLKTHEAEKST